MKRTTIYLFLAWLCFASWATVRRAEKLADALDAAAQKPRFLDHGQFVGRWSVPDLDHGTYKNGTNITIFNCIIASNVCYGIQLYDPYHNLWLWDWWDGPMPLLTDNFGTFVTYTYEPLWVTNHSGSYTGQGIEPRFILTTNYPDGVKINMDSPSWRRPK